MRHSFADQYSKTDSLIRRIDPRVKLISILALILAIIFTPPEAFAAFGLYLALAALLIALSRIPIGFVLKRSLIILPFVAMVGAFIPFVKEGEAAAGYSFGSWNLSVTYNGLMIFWNVLVKAFLSILTMTVLIASTPFPDLLKALQKLKVPDIFIMVISFMYRYAFVLEDELMKMWQAKESRSVSVPWGLQIKTLAHMLGVLFIRAYERGEQVYLAMCSRGFSGEVKTLDDFRLCVKDVCFLLAVVVLACGIRIVGV